MVSQTDLPQINSLFAEQQNINQAMHLFESGGAKIVQVVLADAEGLTVSTLQTSYMQYPPQMVDSIKTMVQARLTAINAELTKLGVTPAKK